MYKKIIILAFIAFCYFSKQSFLFALEDTPEKPVIIPRESWGANELYTEVNSDYWKAIIEARKNHVDTRTPEEKQKDKIDHEKSIRYINENFGEENTITERVLYNEKTGNKYAWPLSYTDYVNAIIVHHTHVEFDDDITGLKNIYKYHSLSNGWGDIGYHYIIGNDGIIYEGRKGGDYVAGAHAKWNNYSTVGIAILGDYHHEPINDLQYQSLETLIRYLAWNYGIDFSRDYYYHMNCSGEKCNTFPLETYREPTLSGHRDAGHTSCPGDELYKQLLQIREDNLEFTKGFTPKKRNSSESDLPNTSISTSIITRYSKLIQGYSIDELTIMKSEIDNLLKNESLETDRRKNLQILRLVIILKINQ